MLGSYGISFKQAYKLSFTLVSKTQTKHLPDQPDLVICSLFANFFKQKVSIIINIGINTYLQTSTRHDSISI